jgi:general stress protein 26
MSNSLVKLPNDIVTYVKVDEQGQLWFLSHHPYQLLNECEKVFPARLHFFRKGRNYFIEVSGKASIVRTVTNANGEKFNKENGNEVLIKMAMNNIQYVEPGSQNSKPKWQELAEKTYTWMLRHVTFQHPETSTFQKFNQRN